MRALGLVFDLSQFGKGKVFIKHTPERKRELVERLEEILTKGSLTPKEAESLKGRIQWYESYLFGRIANLAVHRIGKRALSQPASRNTKLDAELKAALIFLKERVNTGLPLELTAETENALLIFTDGAFESALGSGSVGGILFDAFFYEVDTALSLRDNVVPFICGYVPLCTARHVLTRAPVFGVYLHA